MQKNGTVEEVNHSKLCQCIFLVPASILQFLKKYVGLMIFFVHFSVPRKVRKTLKRHALVGSVRIMR